MNFDEFNKIFCKGMFKDALISITYSFDEVDKMSERKDVRGELPLSLKITEF